jgi:hypothetical protein
MIAPSALSLESDLPLIDFEDLQAIERDRFEYSSDNLLYPNTEQKDVFQTLYQQAEIQDEINYSRGRCTATRRASMHGKSCHKTASSSDVKRYRRHSTFNPRNRQGHRDAHNDFEDYLIHQKNRQRSSIVSTLMDFHSSIEISLAASYRKDMKKALYFSCPILSYMHDTDEDSIEMRKMKRSSLISDPKENESFEYLNDDDDSDSDSDSDISFDVALESEQQEYILGITEKEDVQYLQPGKRRQRHSYKALERRLSTESNLTILKSLMFGETDDLSTEELEDVINIEVASMSMSDRLQEPEGKSQISSARMA